MGDQLTLTNLLLVGIFVILLIAIISDEATL